MTVTEKPDTLFSLGGADMLSPRVAQSIVDRTMSILGVHVNLMDVNATVIAAGNPERVGQFHEGAAKVLKTGKKLSISCSQAKRMEGVMPGVTLPITFKGRLIGAVGMTGDPKDVESFGELLRLTAELMLEQAAVTEEMYLEQRSREGLLTDLLTGRWREYEWYFLRRAKLLNFDLEKKHLVMIAEIGMKDSPAEWLSGGGGLPVQGHRAGLEERIARAELFGGKLMSCFMEGKLAILYGLPEAGMPEGKGAERTIAERVYDIACCGTEVPVTLGVGGAPGNWEELSGLYSNAKDALRLGRLFQKEKPILYFEDYRMEHLLTFIPPPVREEYFRGILGPLLDMNGEQGIQWNKTIQTYFDNDMNSAKTAEALFLHRNTLMFRLNRIMDATGLQPQRFQDAVRLRLALLMLNMQESAAWKDDEGMGKE